MTTKRQSNGTKGANGSPPVDLADLDMLEFGDVPQPLQLVDPRDNQVIGLADGKPATLYVLSYESETMVRYQDELVNKASKKAAVSAEENRERGIKLDARTLMARPWENIPWGGKPLPFNFVNAQMLMSRLPWARRQVTTMASQEAAYLGNSSGSSASTGDGSSNSPSGQEEANEPSVSG